MDYLVLQTKCWLLQLAYFHEYCAIHSAQQPPHFLYIFGYWNIIMNNKNIYIYSNIRIITLSCRMRRRKCIYYSRLYFDWLRTRRYNNSSIHFMFESTNFMLLKSHLGLSPCSWLTRDEPCICNVCTRARLFLAVGSLIDKMRSGVEHISTLADDWLHSTIRNKSSSERRIDCEEIISIVDICMVREIFISGYWHIYSEIYTR